MPNLHLPFRLTAISVCVLASLLTSSSLAQNIQLDPTFGIGGKVTLEFSDSGVRSSHAYHVFSQATGRLVVIGGHRIGREIGTSGIAACGLTMGGTLDGGFGAGGKTLEMNNSYVNAIEPLASGQFLRLGSIFSDLFTSSPRLDRLNSNGLIDNSFAADLNIGSVVPVTLTTRTDGKILVLLKNRDDESHWLMRLNANGSRDSSFGTDGFIPLNLRRLLSRFIVTGFRVLSDNRMVIGGCLNTNPLSISGCDVVWAAVLDEQGNYDRRFGLQGITRFPFPSGVGVSKILVQPDGKVLMIGGANTATNSRVMILRLTTRGRADSGFGQNGIALAPNVGPDSFDGGTSAALMSDGRIVVVGSYAPTLTSGGSFLVARFGASGIRESYAVTQFTPDQINVAYDVTVQQDGRLVVAGYTGNPDASASGELFAIARFTQ